MRIFNPTFGLVPEQQSAAKDRAPVDWFQDPIILFGNSKPNARELLEGLRSRLGEIRNVDQVDFVAKSAAGQPAPVDMIEALAARYKIAVLALAD